MKCWVDKKVCWGFEMLEINKVYNMDCLEGLKLIDDDSIDLIITSPPYNTGIKYDEWNDNLPEEEYEKFIFNVAKECFRVLKADGRICWNVADILHGSKELSFNRAGQFHKIAEQIGFKFWIDIIWYQQDNNSRTCWGSWKSASAPMIFSQFEHILVYYKKYKYKLQKGKSTIGAKMFMECCQDSIWKITPVVTKKNTEYCPVPFPKKLIQRLIHLFSFENDLVLDPFAGSGTTLEVAKSLNRRFIGFELSKKYCEEINKKLQQNYLFKFLK